MPRWVAVSIVCWCVHAVLFAGVRTELFANGFTEPVYATAPPGDERLFVVERAGVVHIVEGGAVLATPFLDIRFEVSSAGAWGMFGMEFDPQYAANGLFYVYYMDLAGEARVSRFSVSADPDVADVASEEVVFALQQPFTDHNGGTIAIRPTDGMMYLAPGDGGGGPYDPNETGQDPQSLLGKMLRIDVSGGPGTVATVPADNPFVGDATILDEIWAFGLRNPYRWSFDRATGDLWIGDVGQSAREEILFEAASDPGGHNYGWDVMEGSVCNFNDPSPLVACNDPSLTLPYFEYDHSAGGCSITGGYVYRGSIPEIQGLYFYADYCTAQVWSLDPQTVSPSDRSAELEPPGTPTFDEIVGFGEDGFGELHIVDYDGEVFRVRSTDADADDDVVPDAVDNCPAVANRDQLDTDGDSSGDACDGDDDDDGTLDESDCAPLDAQAWQLPGTVETLLLEHSGGLAGLTTLNWMAPAAPGGSLVAYDTLAAAGPARFDEPGAWCIETDDTADTTASDAGAPAPGALRYFLIRPGNPCGEASSGRALRTCP